MHYETSEAINQLKYKLEDFEHTNRVFETGFLKGLFYSVMLLEHGKDYAEQKLSADSIRYSGTEVEDLLDKAIAILGNPNVSVEALQEIHNDLETIKKDLFVQIFETPTGLWVLFFMSTL